MVSDISIHGEVYESDQSDIRGPIKVNHHKIGEWWAVCQPGKDGIERTSDDRH